MGGARQAMRRSAQGSRPTIQVEPSDADQVWDLLALLGLVLSMVPTAYAWPHLPERVPTHFGASGQPDGWGPKAMLLLLPAISAVMYAVLTVAARYPHTFNYLVPITAENAEAQYRNAVTMLRAMKAEMTCLLGYLTWQSVQVALGRSAGLGDWFLPVTLVVVFGTVAHFLWKSYQLR